MAQPPPPTGSAAARSALAQKLSGVPPDYFVIKLYQMLQEQREVLTWDPDGGIIIHDRQRLEATLSVYFRHNRFTSFQRQLNNFGFHKKRKPRARRRSSGKAPRMIILSGSSPRRSATGVMGGRGDGVEGAATRRDAVERWSCRGHVRHRRGQSNRSRRWRGPPGRESRREVELPTRARPVNNAAARRDAPPPRRSRSTARQRSARAPPVGEGAFNLLADVAATELRRENSRGELEADAELLTRNASFVRGPRR